MNRRSFFTKLGLAATTVAILPAATTYARKWVASSSASNLWIPNPEWVNAPLEMAFISEQTVAFLPYPKLVPILFTRTPKP